MGKPRTFTLIDIFVVIAILMAILMPALDMVKRNSRALNKVFVSKGHNSVPFFLFWEHPLPKGYRY